MKYSKELLDLIETKKPPTFWHCVNYLLNAGYNQIDSFGVALKIFSENNIFEKVAVIRYEEESIPDHHRMANPRSIFHLPERRLVILMIDDTNVHLSTLFKIYREGLLDGKIPNANKEIEDLCERFTIPDINDILLMLIDKKVTEYFGRELNLKTKKITARFISSGVSTRE